MDKTAETLIDVSGFISEYSAHMMGCGVHTSRVIRSANRIGESFGYVESGSGNRYISEILSEFHSSGTVRDLHPIPF